MESLKGASMTQSKSSVCINGSHVYDSEPSTPRGSAAHPCKLVLLEKCTPLSRSLQNLTKRSEDRGSFAEGRRWSFDKVKKEEKEEEKDPLSLSPPARTGSQPVQGATPAVSSTAGSPDKGKKPRKMLFSTGRCESLPAKSDLNQAPSLSDRRLRGWFGSGESQNKPRTHPVKPLTSGQSEKKESRSVLEKLKSTIAPGWSAQQVTAEPQKIQEVTEDRSAQYQHLTNMELISLLLQQEMDMQKQQAASEQQEAQLQKCEAELRKVKSQVRDLEDYIDNLLLRIMEQTPTLLQVRSRHK
ncbi:hypothetical protein fugu_013528 [Takifugu bimaculatus]|uniref:FIP-RBD domain-containing protein n=1 Tax=Takifugu bimaculatus TaxID=433685 RepID=A0A4Z2C3M0_9TELE|nr:hypothetical protein fugu_013528 [Takifugu bimaculatus]